MFRTNTAGRLDYRVQETPMVGATGYRSDVWLGTQVIDAGPGPAGTPSVTLTADNTVEVVATGMDGVMYSLRQTAWDNALTV